MLLAEAIKEKDYLERSIRDIEYYISMFSIVIDKSDFKLNKSLIEEKLERLKELTKKYQQFSITIERSKAKSIIKVNNTELSLLDAESIKKSMELKLEIYENLINLSNEKYKNNGIICLDIDQIFKEVEELKIDIKTLESEIEYACWHIEV